MGGRALLAQTAPLNRPAPPHSSPRSQFDSSLYGRPRDVSPCLLVGRGWTGRIHMWWWAGAHLHRPWGGPSPCTGVPRAPTQRDADASSAHTSTSAGEATRGLKWRAGAVGSVGRPPPGSAGPAEAPCPQAAGFGNDIFTVPRVLLPRRIGG